MDLSVVIVNYNVRHFLEQALHSVRRAMQGIAGEVWVVDNNSVDDSVRMVREKFPEVRLIANTNNPGFAVANNQAIRECAGRYVLMLNPDTLVEEDTFRQCIDFMDAHPNAGALGVRLIDGSGRYLPESKRGFPTPWVAFCKSTGLSTLFPRSRWFNSYYLGHLSADETHPIDVLAGCFMFMRREALEQVGLLDEAFFMYGEDIDLSYRITRGGYQNYYYPGTQIIHYKGESTKKGSLNYVRVFYQAMIIFARKHFQGRQAGLFVFMLQVAIWLRAGLTLLQNTLRALWLPLLDAALIFGGLLFLKDYWANYYYKDPTYFKPPVLRFNFPLYTAVWVVCIWLNGGYDHRYDLRRLVRGLALGALILAAVYGFLNEDLRSSRALLLLGAAWAVLTLVALRILLHFLTYRNLRVGREQVRQVAIVGSPAESERVVGLLQQAGVSLNLVGMVTPVEPQMPPNLYLNTIDRLEEVVRIFRIDELIFCSKDVPAHDIMAWMTRLGPDVLYKIVPEESLSIIGSSSKNEPGELYTIDIRYNIAQPGQRRNKRVLDVLICLVALLTSPVWLFFAAKRSLMLQYWLPVLLGRRTWVGYAAHPDNGRLPRLAPAVFTTAQGIEPEPNAAVAGRLNFLYAKDWDVWRDVRVLWFWG
ncbi:MAG: glycosyltransferase [Saprospiraceae bacterium]